MACLTLAAPGCVGSRQKKDTTQADQAVAEHNAESSKGERIVCRRERIPGSHRSERVCRTVSDRRRQRDDAGDMMRHARPEPPTGEGGF